MKLQRVTIKRWGWLAKKLNEIIDALNILLNMQVHPSNSGKFTAVKGNAVLELIQVGNSAVGGGSSGSFPAGTAGDILYHNGSDWVVLDAPTGFTRNPVLRHNGTAPYWEEPSTC